MRWRRFVFLAGALAAACAGACQLLVPVHDEDGVERPDAADVADGGSDAAPDVVDPCSKIVPPPPPAPEKVTDAATGDILSFAFRTFRVHPGIALGYDLDGHCTGDPTSTTADSPCVPTAGTDTTNLNDYDGGVDDSIGRAFDSFGDQLGDVAAVNIDRSVATGSFTLLLQLSSYNGEPNDTDVHVALVTSPRLLERCDHTDGGPPGWDGGCDTWATSGALAPGGGPITTNHLGGYVVDDTLVVRRGAEAPSEIDFSIGRSRISLNEALLTARIERDASTKITGLTQGVLVGRAAVVKLLEFLDCLEVSLDPASQDPPAALCEQADGSGPAAEAVRGFESQMRDSLCAHIDVPFSAARDGKGDECNAVSFALGFDAYPARIGANDPVALPVCPELDAGCR